MPTECPPLFPSVFGCVEGLESFPVKITGASFFPRFFKAGDLSLLSGSRVARGIRAYVPCPNSALPSF